MSQIPMVSVREMPVLVLDHLREASNALDNSWRSSGGKLPYDLAELRETIKLAYKQAIAIQTREDREELARRKYVEATLPAT